MKLVYTFALAAVLLSSQSCRTRKTATDKTVTETSTSDSKVNTTKSDITTVKAKDITLKVEADSSEAVFQVKPGTKLKEIANLSGRRSSVASVSIDTAGILRIKCKCDEETLKETIYELERTITNLRDSVSTSNRNRSEVKKETAVIEKPSFWKGVKWSVSIVFFIGIIAALLAYYYAKRVR